MVNVVPISPVLVILITKAIGSSETSLLTKATRLNIPEDGILLSYLRETLKSYIVLTASALYPSSFITMQGLILLTLSRTTFASADRRYWNIRHTHQIRLRAFMISSPKLKNCDGHVTTQERRLLVL
jgi:hypothetical protein